MRILRTLRKRLGALPEGRAFESGSRAPAKHTSRKNNVQKPWICMICCGWAVWGDRSEAGCRGRTNDQLLTRQCCACITASVRDRPGGVGRHLRADQVGGG